MVSAIPLPCPRQACWHRQRGREQASLAQLAQRRITPIAPAPPFLLRCCACATLAQPATRAAVSCEPGVDTVTR